MSCNNFWIMTVHWSVQSVKVFLLVALAPCDFWLSKGPFTHNDYVCDFSFDVCYRLMWISPQKLDTDLLATRNAIAQCERSTNFCCLENIASPVVYEYCERGASCHHSKVQCSFFMFHWRWTFLTQEFFWVYSKLISIPFTKLMSLARETFTCIVAD